MSFKQNVIYVIKADDEISSTLRGIQNNTSNMTTSFAKANLAVLAIQKGLGLAKDAITGLINVSKDSVLAFADFDNELRRAGVLTKEAQSNMGALKGAMDELKEAAIEAGLSSTFSAQEMASAFKEIAAVGDFTTNQIIELGNAAKDLAVAAGLDDVERSAFILTATMQQFGVATEDASSVADILSKAANISALEIGDLGEALKFVGPVSKAAGQSLEDTSAALAILSNRGFTASTAGTGLRRIMQSMIDPTSGATSKMEELGLSFFDSEGKMKSLENLIPEVATALNGMATEQDRLNAVSTIFGVRGGAALLAMFDKNAKTGKFTTEAFKELNTQMDAAQGTTKTLGDEMKKGLTFQLDEMMESVKTLQLIFGEALLPIVKALIPVVETLVGKIAEFLQTPEVQILIQSLANTFQLFFDEMERSGALDAIFDVLVELAPVLSEILFALQPIIPVFVELIKEMAELAKDILPELLPLIRFLVDLFATQLIVQMKIMTETLKLMKTPIKTLLKFLEAMRRAFVLLLEGLDNFFRGILELDLDKLLKGFDQVVKGIVGIFASLIAGAFQIGIDFVQAIAKGMLEAVPRLIGEVADEIGKFFGGSLPEVGPLIHVRDMGKDLITQGFAPGVQEGVETALSPTLEGAIPGVGGIAAAPIGGARSQTIIFEQVNITARSNDPDELSDEFIDAVRRRFDEETVFEVGT